MQTDPPSDSQRIRRIQSLSLQLNDLIATSARQRRALEELLQEALALVERIEEERARSNKTRTAGSGS
jgi:hypothetical protein